jgi:hypothetical protein
LTTGHCPEVSSPVVDEELKRMEPPIIPALKLTNAIRYFIFLLLSLTLLSHPPARVENFVRINC